MDDWTPEMDEAFNEIEKQSNLGKQILKEIKPQREWVGLTDEEVNQLYTQIQEQVDKHWVDGGTSMMFPTTLYKAIEDKLKEKNHAT
jgi:hypothetical protein